MTGLDFRQQPQPFRPKPQIQPEGDGIQDSLPDPLLQAFSPAFLKPLFLDEFIEVSTARPPRSARRPCA
jgi:hypothetical protein